MIPLIEKLGTLERKMASERGDFVLFALFLREDAEDKWDVVVSAPWFKDATEGLDLIAKEIRKTVEPPELLSLSRIVVLPSDDPRLEAILKAIQVEHGSVEVVNSVFFGLHIDRAYFVTAKRPPTPTGRVQ